MEWKEIYKNRFATVEEAVRAIEDGDRLVFGHAAGCPQVVPAEMIAQKERLHDVGIYHMLTLNDGSYLTPGTEGHFRHITNFVGGNSRQAVADDRADFLPVFFYEIPQLFDEVYPVDVAVIQVSYPDSEGNCSFGLSCDYTKAAAEKARLVIAEMNENMSRETTKFISPGWIILFRLTWHCPKFRCLKLRMSKKPSGVIVLL